MKITNTGRKLPRVLSGAVRRRIVCCLLAVIVLVYIYTEKWHRENELGGEKRDVSRMVTASRRTSHDTIEEGDVVGSSETIGENYTAMAAMPSTLTTTTEATTDSKIKYILFWNEYYGHDDFGWGKGQRPFLDAQCRQSACYGTNDRALMPMDQFDAILFHMQTASRWPRFRSPHQRYVFVTKETPAYLFNDLRRFPNYFNWTMTYRLSSDFPIPYGKIERISNQQKQDDGATRINYARGKTKLAAWFVSNCRSTSRREKYVEQLQRHMPVDIYGKCGRLKCPRSENRTCHKLLLDKYYKFYLSFENSICMDYVTEKFFDALRYNVIPVVLGGANYSEIAPPHSFIDALKYSPKQLADYLKLLDNNDLLYNSYFEWKHQYEILGNVFEKPAFCDLCEQLHTSTHKVYNNIYEWWSKRKCNKWKM